MARARIQRSATLKTWQQNPEGFGGQNLSTLQYSTKPICFEGPKHWCLSVRSGQTGADDPDPVYDGLHLSLSIFQLALQVIFSEVERCIANSPEDLVYFSECLVLQGPFIVDAKPQNPTSVFGEECSTIIMHQYRLRVLACSRVPQEGRMVY